MYRYFILFCLIASQADAQSITVSGGGGSIVTSGNGVSVAVSKETVKPPLKTLNETRLEDLEYRLDFLESTLKAATEKPVIAKPSVELVIHPKKQRRYVAFFTASWCGNCKPWKQKEKKRLENAGITVVEYEMTETRHKVKYSDSKRGKLQVRSFPTFAIIDSDTGEWLSDPIVGYTSADTLIPMLGEPVQRTVVTQPKTEYVIQPSQPGRYTTYNGRTYDWENETYQKCALRRCEMCDYLYNACWNYRNYRQLINKIDPQAPTPDDAIEEALNLLDLKPDSVLCDLGCGDARVLIRAVQKVGCKAIGIEIDEVKVLEARRSIADAGLSGLITINPTQNGDSCSDVKDFVPSRHGVTAAYCYLYPELLGEIADKLKDIPVVVSAGHKIPGLEQQVLIGQCWVHRI